jgi:predicted AlkP superfamily pyrophosphatase or phosphodiesterase
MRRFVSLLILIAALGSWLTLSSAQNVPAPAALKPSIILVSFDGFRWDYMDKAPTPNLRSLAARGMRADGLIPSYPSKTFPNHYTIVTGLYPGHHGIVANNILDTATGRRFAPGIVNEVQDAMWWGGEPIWVTAQRGGLVTGAMYWPGSEAPIRGVLPRYWNAYATALPPDERVEQVLRWMDLPDTERPRLITLYFADVDTAGHADGPDSPAVRDAIMRVDGYLGNLVRGLERRRLLDQLNIVVVSDHGMAATDIRHVVVLDDYISLDDVDVVDINPTLAVIPKPGREDAVYRALSRAKHLKVYRRAETPERWHYRDHPHIPPIVGGADEGWQVVRKVTLGRVLAGLLHEDRGAHGYDPKFKSMRGIFVAAGPAFKQGATVRAFENIHIYDALAQVLGVTPAPNDGDAAIARTLLK